MKSWSGRVDLNHRSLDPQSNVQGEKSVAAQGIFEHPAQNVPKNVPSASENTPPMPISAASANTPGGMPSGSIPANASETDALTLAHAIAAVDALPLTPEVKADIIKRLAGL